MEIVVSSIATKRDLVTLDLLGPDPSSGGLDPRLRISSDGDYLPPLGRQSVCTIEKVKQALERETERRKGAASDGGEGSLSTSASPSSSSSSSSSVTTVSAKRFADRGDEGSPPDRGDSAAGRGGSLVVAGCSGCLSYVLIPKGNPRCPRCDARVTPPLTVASPPAPLKKKPRIDLNSSLTTL
ncbi:hypothetical protein ZIOFF_065317 [Zingiber officinale]|uniref:GIR1-like zinc ribbon domain-containing protein n=1 Tax=Zingiber officinale TaxID=94328 RepID=A0A8J5EX00_ZINOF|nr:hypothetical protein ZIOFF_065317 [Zingiber officinale]